MTSIFFGSPDFAVPVLNKLAASDTVSVEGVVTTPDSPIATRADQSKIPTFSLKEFEEQALADENGADIYIVAAYGKILSKELIEKPRYKTLNIHPSLLPKLRGPSPIKTAILKNHVKTGVSIILMDKSMDTGPLLAQARVPLRGDEIFTHLIFKLFTLGADLLLEALPLWKDYCNQQSTLPKNWQPKTENSTFYLPPQPQDHSQATYTQKLTREDGKIDWDKTDEEIDRMVRALNPWPGAWSSTVELSKALSTSYKPPATSSKKKRVSLLVTHLNNRGNLAIDRLQVEGKEPISWEEFRVGYLKKV